MAGYFHLYFKVWSAVGKKLKCCFINTIFLQPCMAGEFPPITKEVAWKKICAEIIYSIKRNTIISFFSKFLVTFLRNTIKCIVLRALSGALSGALKVVFLRAVTIQGAFSDDSFKFIYLFIFSLFKDDFS